MMGAIKIVNGRSARPMYSTPDSRFASCITMQAHKCRNGYRWIKTRRVLDLPILFIVISTNTSQKSTDQKHSPGSISAEQAQIQAWKRGRIVEPAAAMFIRSRIRAPVQL